MKRNLITYEAMEVTREVSKAHNPTRSIAKTLFLPTSALLFWLPRVLLYCPGSAGPPHALLSECLPNKLPRFPRRLGLCGRQNFFDTSELLISLKGLFGTYGGDSGIHPTPRQNRWLQWSSVDENQSVPDSRVLTEVN